jgi:hypothetical protein
MPACAALAANGTALHCTLVAAAGAAAFATAFVATGLLSSATLTALVATSTSIAVLLSFV